MVSTLNWLKRKLLDGENGIIIDTDDSFSFNLIQEFIDSYDRDFKTPIIYYQAFPEESIVQFLDTLKDELLSKLGKSQLSSQLTLLDTIQDTELKMIVIDRCYLHPSDTLQNLLDFCSSCGIAVILVGTRTKMTMSQVLSNPQVSDWDCLAVEQQCKC